MNTASGSQERWGHHGYHKPRREYIYGHPLEEKCEKKNVKWKWIIPQLVMIWLVTSVIVRKVELFREATMIRDGVDLDQTKSGSIRNPIFFFQFSCFWII